MVSYYFVLLPQKKIALLKILILKCNLPNISYAIMGPDIKVHIKSCDIKKKKTSAFTLLLLLLLSHFSPVRLCATPETAAHQAPPSLGFSRQEHWSGLPLPSPMHESEKGR